MLPKNSQFLHNAKNLPQITNDSAFTLLSIKDKVFARYFQLMRVMPICQTHTWVPACSVAALKLSDCGSHESISTDALAQVCAKNQSSECSAGSWLYCTNCIGSDYATKIGRAGECYWWWKYSRLLWNSLNIPGGIWACTYYQSPYSSRALPTT